MLTVYLIVFHFLKVHMAFVPILYFFENSKIYKLRKIYISNILFRKKYSNYFRNLIQIFFRKRSFLNFLNKKKIWKIFLFLKIWIQIYLKI